MCWKLKKLFRFIFLILLGASLSNCSQEKLEKPALPEKNKANGLPVLIENSESMHIEVSGDKGKDYYDQEFKMHLKASPDVKIKYLILNNPADEALNCINGTEFIPGDEVEIPVGSYEGETKYFYAITCASGQKAFEISRQFTYDSKAPTEPIFSQTNETFEEDFSLKLTIDTPDPITSELIRYTVDGGSLPDCNAGTLYEQPIAINGNTRVRAIACDALGHMSPEVSHTFVKQVISEEPILLSGEFSINSHEDLTRSSVVNLRLNSPEAIEMFVTNTPGCETGGIWEPFASTKEWTLSQSNTTAIIFVKFRDHELNASECLSGNILHDDSAPIAKIHDAPNKFSNVTELNVTISGSELESYQYNIALAGNPCTFVGPWLKLSENAKITDALGSDGAYELCVRGRDIALNEQEIPTRYSWIKSTSGPIVSIDSIMPNSDKNLIINADNELAFPASGSCTVEGGTVVIGGAEETTAPCVGGTWSKLIDYSNETEDSVLITADMTDAASNTAVQASVNIPRDTERPTVQNVESTTPPGFYFTGFTIPIHVQFSEIVYVTGTPTLKLELDGQAKNVSYTGGSGTTVLVFSYTIEAGDTTNHLGYTDSAALSVESGSIMDASYNDATTILPGANDVGSLRNNNHLLINIPIP